MEMFEGGPVEPFSQRSRYMGTTNAGHRLIGIYVGRQCDMLVGSLVSVSGNKLAATYENVLTQQVEIPGALRNIFSDW